MTIGPADGVMCLIDHNHLPRAQQEIGQDLWPFDVIDGGDGHRYRRPGIDSHRHGRHPSAECRDVDNSTIYFKAPPELAAPLIPQARRRQNQHSIRRATRP